MKAKYDFENVELAGEIMAVPIGEKTSLFTGMLKLNETGAFILDLLKNDISEEEIIQKALEEYSGDKNEIKEYVHSFLVLLKEKDIIE